MPIITVKCEKCGFVVAPNDKGRCPVCGTKLKVKEHVL